MDVIDNALGMDWSDSRYVGDGVYIRDASDQMGIASIALRTTREGRVDHVIVLERRYFEAMATAGQELMASDRRE